MNIFKGRLVRTAFVTAMLGLVFGILLYPEPGTASGRKHYRIKQVPSYHDEYDYVHPDKAGFPLGHQYPAPSGEEDKELLPETWQRVNEQLNGIQTDDGISSERHDGSKNCTGMPDWWFSQVIGADPASSGRHIADMINTGTDPSLEVNYFDPSHNWDQRNGGRERKYGAAFDIVLGDVPVRNQPADIGKFDLYVTALRNGGIVAWERWMDEIPGVNDLENEMHCVDPASPFMKSTLRMQIKGPVGFIKKRAGEPNYQMDLNDATQEQWDLWLQNVRLRQEGANGEDILGLYWLVDKYHHPGLRACTDSDAILFKKIPD